MFILRKIEYLVLFICLLRIKLASSIAWSDGNKIIAIEEDKGKGCSIELRNHCLKELKDSSKPASNLPLRKYYWNRSRKNAPLIESNSSCQCEMSYRLMDLGSSIYPRYVPTGVCKRTNCDRFHRCKPKMHQLRLLKKRDSDELQEGKYSEDAELHLPESLADDWVSVQVKIIIGCECKPVIM
ncbi:prothoracicotropic hormone [Euwallacea similis]|uniref:prothoracicotropic hormone n=1 Tax=Euwallacea similis TaxID=1736056 RepID=UPI003450080B